MLFFACLVLAIVGWVSDSTEKIAHPLTRDKPNSVVITVNQMVSSRGLEVSFPRFNELTLSV